MPVELETGIESSNVKDPPARVHRGGPGRLARLLFSTGNLVAAITLVLASPSYAAVPDAQQQKVWDHACVSVAQGSVSPQEALVCTHSGFPQWVDHVLDVVQRICERPLGGTFVYRSEVPVELAACFLP